MVRVLNSDLPMTLSGHRNDSLSEEGLRRNQREPHSKFTQCNMGPFLRKRGINLQTLGQRFLKGVQRKFVSSGAARLVEVGWADGKFLGQTVGKQAFCKDSSSPREKPASICSSLTSSNSPCLDPVEHGLMSALMCL